MEASFVGSRARAARSFRAHFVLIAGLIVGLIARLIADQALIVGLIVELIADRTNY